jgi:serine/threonine protein kinase
MHPDKIIQNYRLVRFIGDGGMGQVWLAEHTLLKRQVAIKALHHQFVRNTAIRARFRQEASTLAHLQHPGIVALHDYIEDDEGAYLVMEYVEGTPLDEFISRHSGPIATPQLEQMFAQILDGFIYAHGKQVVHRDIKPSNFLVTKAGSIKILDFGIAKILSGTDNKLTKTGTNMGTVFYMSPEQVKGESVDIRSDIYSLGVTLFQMATGQCPYQGETTEFKVYDQIVNQRLPNASSFYPGATAQIDALIHKATEKDPNRRFQNCNTFKEALFRQSPSPVEPIKTIEAKPEMVAAPVQAQTVAEERPAATDVTPKPKKSQALKLTLALLGIAALACIVVFVVVPALKNSSQAEANTPSPNEESTIVDDSPPDMSTAEGVVRGYVYYMGKKEYRSAYDLGYNVPSWRTYDFFSAPTSFGGIDSSSLKSIVDKGGGKFEVEVYFRDPVNGDGTFKQKYQVAEIGGAWKITKNETIDSDRPQDHFKFTMKPGSQDLSDYMVLSKVKQHYPNQSWSGNQLRGCVNEMPTVTEVSKKHYFKQKGNLRAFVILSTSLVGFSCDEWDGMASHADAGHCDGALFESIDGNWNCLHIATKVANGAEYGAPGIIGDWEQFGPENICIPISWYWMGQGVQSSGVTLVGNVGDQIVKLTSFDTSSDDSGNDGTTCHEVKMELSKVIGKPFYQLKTTIYDCHLKPIEVVNEYSYEFLNNRYDVPGDLLDRYQK